MRQFISRIVHIVIETLENLHEWLAPRPPEQPAPCLREMRERRHQPAPRLRETRERRHQPYFDTWRTWVEGRAAVWPSDHVEGAEARPLPSSQQLFTQYGTSLDKTNMNIGGMFPLDQTYNIKRVDVEVCASSEQIRDAVVHGTVAVLHVADHEMLTLPLYYILHAEGPVLARGIAIPPRQHFCVEIQFSPETHELMTRLSRDGSRATEWAMVRYYLDGVLTRSF